MPVYTPGDVLSPNSAAFLDSYVPIKLASKNYADGLVDVDQITSIKKSSFFTDAIVHQLLTPAPRVVDANSTAMAFATGQATTVSPLLKELFFVVSFGVPGDTLSSSVRIDVTVQESPDGTTYSAAPDANYELVNAGFLPSTVEKPTPTSGIALRILDNKYANNVYAIRYLGNANYVRLFMDLSGTHSNGTASHVVAVQRISGPVGKTNTVFQQGLPPALRTADAFSSDVPGNQKYSAIIGFGSAGDTLSGSVLTNVSLQDAQTMNGVALQARTADTLVTPNLSGNTNYDAATNSIQIDANAKAAQAYLMSYLGNEFRSRLFLDITGTHSVGTFSSIIYILNNK